MSQYKRWGYWFSIDYWINARPMLARLMEWDSAHLVQILSFKISPHHMLKNNFKIQFKKYFCKQNHLHYFELLSLPLSYPGGGNEQVSSHFLAVFGTVVWGCRIQWLHLCKISPMSVLDMMLNNLMVRFQ